MIRDQPVPMPSRSSTRSAPWYARTRISAHHSRCTTHAGMPRVCPSQKNGPIGKR